MAELVDAYVSEAYGVYREGSSPSARTNIRGCKKITSEN